MCVREDMVPLRWATFMSFYCSLLFSVRLVRYSTVIEIDLPRTSSLHLCSDVADREAKRKLENGGVDSKKSKKKGSSKKTAKSSGAVTSDTTKGDNTGKRTERGSLPVGTCFWRRFP